MTNRDINKLAPNFKLKVELFLKEVWDIIFITEGIRTKERQDYLYAQWRSEPYLKESKVTWVKYSNHQDWIAIDIAFKWDSLYPNNIEQWDLIARIANKYWIDWGYDLWGIDLPHFQDNWKPYIIKEETMSKFGKLITYKDLTYPSSIYWIPVVVKKTDSAWLMWYASIKWYAPKSKKDEIFISDNTFTNWQEYLLKVIIHESFHFFQHLAFSDEQNKYIEDLFKFIPDKVSNYAKTLHWEDWAETFAYWKVYIDNNKELPKGKVWDEALDFKYNAYLKFVESREKELIKLIKERK